MESIREKSINKTKIREELKIIFLDTNGVLNYTKHREQELKHRRTIEFSKMRLSSTAISLVGKLAEEYNALVVCTSSWRCKPMHREYLNLTKQLKDKANIEVFDKTPTLGNNTEKHEEIREWFNINKGLKINNYVIIDDEQMLGFENNHVKCNAEYGFTKVEYNKAKNILSNTGGYK